MGKEYKVNCPIYNKPVSIYFNMIPCPTQDNPFNTTRGLMNYCSLAKTNICKNCLSEKLLDKER